MKLLIFGVPGSGKTHLANRLGVLMGLKVFHIDRHFFEKGWVERPQEAFLKDVQKHLEENEWIIDGNAMRTLEMRYREADVAIYCRLPWRLCFARLLYRWLSTLLNQKPDGPDGATNGVSWRLLKYQWQFTKRYDPYIERLRRVHPHVRYVCVRSASEMSQLLNELITEPRVDVTKE